MSDPAILGGMMPNTITPGMLEQVTYEPLPGWNKVEAAAVNQPNSLSGMIAAKILSGQDAFAAYTDIVTILSDPDSEQYQMLAPLVPAQPAGQYATNDPLAKFDLDAVKKLAESYQSAVNNEPIPQVNPETGDFVRDQSNRIAVEVRQETPQGQWFRETGTPLPWEEWNTNDFASPVQQQYRDESFAKTAAAEDEWNDFRSKVPAQMPLTGADREAYITNLMKANVTTPDYPGFTNQTNTTFNPNQEEDGGGFSFGPIAQVAAATMGLVPSAAVLAGRKLWGSDIPGALDRNVGDPVENFFNGLSVGTGQIAPDEEGGHIPYPALIRQGEANGSFVSPTEYPGGYTNPTNKTFDRGAPSSNGREAPSSNGWDTPEGGTRRGPARGSRYEAELRLRAEEKRRGPTGREATPQSKKAWEKVVSQRRKNHQQLADEALRKRMIAQLMGAGVTPYTSTMNSRGSDAQQSGFGY
jgi:hypothetical protein